MIPMADHIVLGHPRRPYIKIEKVQLVEKQTDREQRKKQVCQLQRPLYFPMDCTLLQYITYQYGNEILYRKYSKV